VNNPDSNSNSFASQTGAGNMVLADVMQVFSQSQRSGQITYAAGDNYGLVYLQHGQIIHSVLNQIEGEEAIYVMLEWKNATFSFDDGILPHRRSISRSLEELLLEGARRSDLGNLPRPDTNTSSTASSASSSSNVGGSRIQGGQPRLCIYNNKILAQTFEITQEYTRIGRVTGNDIILPDPSVSSRHCILIRSGDDILVRDLNSSNGTLINNERITEKVLMLGDTLHVGGIALQFESAIRRPKLTTDTTPVGVHGQASTANNPTIPGVRPIVYEDIAPPQVPAKTTSPLVIILTVFALILVALAVYFLVFKK
jgi:hypothetical protein